MDTDLKSKMRTFLNREVAEIVGVTQRQILNWTEKGLVQPYVETTGAGVKRQYSYVNLLEFALVKALYEAGMGFQGIKKALSGLRDHGRLEEWATDFSRYYEGWHKHSLAVIEDMEWESSSDKENLLLKMGEGTRPPASTGFLFLFFGKAKDYYIIVPEDADYAFNLLLIKECAAESSIAVVVNLGAIKLGIEAGL